MNKNRLTWTYLVATTLPFFGALLLEQQIAFPITTRNVKVNTAISQSFASIPGNIFGLK